MRRTLVVGDVHGCIDELRDLVARHAASDDLVVLVGDLVAKGPDSQAVVAFARERGMRAVLGNHDNKVLECRTPRPGQTAPKAHHHKVAATLEEDDWRYLEALPLWLDLGEGFAVLHGGAVPGVPLASQERDHLLAMRSVTDDDRPSTRIEGRPWASLWPGPEHVLFGHDAVRGLQRCAHATGLDTGCVYGKELTGMVLPERRLVSVPARRAYAPM